MIQEEHVELIIFMRYFFGGRRIQPFHLERVTFKDTLILYRLQMSGGGAR